MIATDALVIIRCLVLVERVRSEVQHTVVESFVAKDDLIRFSHLLRGVAHARFDKHAVVEIALVYLPHIDEAEQSDASYGQFGIELLLIEQEQDDRADGYDDEGTERIRREDIFAYRRQVSLQATDELRCLCTLLGDLSELLHLCR